MPRITAILRMALCAPVLLAAQSSELEAVLNRLVSPNVHVAGAAFYELMGSGRANDTVPDTVAKLMRAHPGQADDFKLALIKALEAANAYKESTEEADQRLDEASADYRTDLAWAVGSLRDPRAVKGLVGALEAGALADLFPFSVDALIEMSHRPARYRPGMTFDYRAAALTIFSVCLTRQALMRANPEAVAKVRAFLLDSLDSPDWLVREWAAEDLSAFREDPEVRAKLGLLARTDPYISARPRSGKGQTPFSVRDAASSALAPRNESDLLYVMRSAESGECRVQRGSEPPVGERFIGPVTDAKHEMCIHYDATGKDPFLCWQIYPRGACSQ